MTQETWVQFEIEAIWDTWRETKDRRKNKDIHDGTIHIKNLSRANFQSNFLLRSVVAVLSCCPWSVTLLVAFTRSKVEPGNKIALNNKIIEANQCRLCNFPKSLSSVSEPWLESTRVTSHSFFFTSWCSFLTYKVQIIILNIAWFCSLLPTLWRSPWSEGHQAQWWPQAPRAATWWCRGWARVPWRSQDFPAAAVGSCKATTQSHSESVWEHARPVQV